MHLSENYVLFSVAIFLSMGNLNNITHMLERHQIDPKHYLETWNNTIKVGMCTMLKLKSYELFKVVHHFITTKKQFLSVSK